MKRKKRKSALTLIEIMIVIFIIGMISSVVGVNMRKSLEKGKHFKTKQAITKLYNIVEIEVAGGAESDALSQDNLSESDLMDIVKRIVRGSNFVKKSSDVLVDGWGKSFAVEARELKGEEDLIVFISKSYENYCDKNNIKYDYPWITDQDDQEEN